MGDRAQALEALVGASGWCQDEPTTNLTATSEDTMWAMGWWKQLLPALMADDAAARETRAANQDNHSRNVGERQSRMDRENARSSHETDVDMAVVVVDSQDAVQGSLPSATLLDVAEPSLALTTGVDMSGTVVG